MKNFTLLASFLFISGCSQKNITLKNQFTPCKSTCVTQLQTMGDFEKLLNKEIQQYDARKILVVFDFNYTLLQPTDPALHKKNIEKYKVIFTKLLKSIPKEEVDLILNKTLINENQKLVSKKTPALIQKFQKQGVNFIVCTGTLSKTNGQISADIIERLLKKRGIILNQGCFSFAETTFKEFKEYLNYWPSYKNNIITTNKENKGLVLSSFLKKLPQNPKIVIFVDDNPKKANDVLKISSDFEGVNFIVCEYKESENTKVPKIGENEFLEFWSKKTIQK